MCTSAPQPDSVSHKCLAMAALFFLMLHLALMFFEYNQAEVAVVMVLAAICMVVVGMAFMRYRSEPLLTILVNSFIYYVYLWARGLSVLFLPGIRNIRKRTR